ncbi:MAG: DNA-processing protein DprA, partial [Pseudomonadota bacterium]
MLRGPVDEEVVDWLRLIRSHNVGPATFLSLLSRFGDAKEALAALPALTQKVGGRAPIVIASRDSVLREMDRAARLGAHHVFLGTPDYPPKLAAIHAPPPVVMVRGDARLMSKRAIGVVGARKASAAGKTMA